MSFFFGANDSQIRKITIVNRLAKFGKLASCRLGTKPLLGFFLGGLDPLSPLMIERPSRPCQFSDTETIEIGATVSPPPKKIPIICQGISVRRPFFSIIANFYHVPANFFVSSYVLF